MTETSALATRSFSMVAILMLAYKFTMIFTFPMELVTMEMHRSFLDPLVSILPVLIAMVCLILVI